MAVPGPVIGGASAGTNDLLADGAGVVRGADDVLAALGMTPGARRSSIEPRSKPAGDAAVVLEALGWQPATLDQLTLRTTLNLDAAVLAVEHLRRSGWVTEQGGWIEQCPRPHG
jgi:DNA processing protein